MKTANHSVQFVTLLCTFICLIGAGPLRAATWITSLEAARAQAKAEHKSILINFTGSDWCGWCIRLRNEVFSKSEFAAYAEKNLVLVEVDFPRRKPQSGELKKANQAMAEKFGVKGFPTVVLLDADGNSRGVTGYMEGGAQHYVAALQKAFGSTSAGAGAAKQAPKPTQPALLFGGARTFPPPVYSDLQLKGLSGSASRRFALINNQTLGVGESATVKLGDNEVLVRCLDIGPESAVVLVGPKEERRELRLSGAARSR